MANLYGRMIDPYHSGRREVTRTAARMIQSRRETWDGSVKTELGDDGTFRVYVGEKNNPRTLNASGNVNRREGVVV
jgi:hypothetical protein